MKKIVVCITVYTLTVVCAPKMSQYLLYWWMFVAGGSPDAFVRSQNPQIYTDLHRMLRRILHNRQLAICMRHLNAKFCVACDADRYVCMFIRIALCLAHTRTHAHAHAHAHKFRRELRVYACRSVHRLIEQNTNEPHEYNRIDLNRIVCYAIKINVYNC